MESPGLIQPHGGYNNLVSYRVAQLCHDVTVRFCDRYIERGSRTHDQMVQAARSGVQNIVEGSKFGGTSSKLEMKLTNVARGSLEELRTDYRDFLRQRGLHEWDRGDPRRASLVARRCATADEVARWIVECGADWGDGPDGKNGPDGHNGPDGLHGRPHSIESIRSIGSIKSIESIPPIESLPLAPVRRAASPWAGPAANAALVLIGVATALLTRQLKAQAAAFERDGGFTERLYRMRSRARRG